MEVESKVAPKDRLANLFLKDKLHFTNRREINWKSIRQCAVLGVGLAVLTLLFLPNDSQEIGSFAEKSEAAAVVEGRFGELLATQDTLAQINSGRTRSSGASRSFDSFYQGSNSASAGESRSSSMIITRGGLDSKTQLPPGSRISVKLYESAIVANQGMPVIGYVTRDYVHEENLAIPAGSKIFGEISFEDSGDRAKVDWRSIQFPDGRERQLSAIGVGEDGQVGVKGRVHSEALKNTAGATLTRFIAAYAEGSMQRGMLGASQGGNDNGWKNAISETAKDRAEIWAEQLKKEKKWIEVSNQAEFFAVLTQSLAFRDPGNTNGN